MPLNLWLHQTQAVLRLELKKTFFARRGLWIYVLAFLPALMFGAHSFFCIRHSETCNFGEDINIFATTFQLFYLRLAIFFGCLGIFMNLFRGEVLDKSLHFYFLAPIRREVLLAGKFAAGLIASIVIFSISVLLQLALLFMAFDRLTIQDYLFRGNGLSHLAAYLGVTALACAGYGSVFLAAGILIRNPIVPAAAVLVWEGANAFLPPLLQKFSVIYYLKSLCPIGVLPDVPPPFSMLVVNPDPISPILAIAGLLLLAAAVLWLASQRVRLMEINYSAD